MSKSITVTNGRGVVISTHWFLGCATRKAVELAKTIDGVFLVCVNGQPKSVHTFVRTR